MRDIPLDKLHPTYQAVIAAEREKLKKYVEKLGDDEIEGIVQSCVKNAIPRPTALSGFDPEQFRDGIDHYIEHYTGKKTMHQINIETGYGAYDPPGEED